MNVRALFSVALCLGVMTACAGSTPRPPPSPIDSRPASRSTSVEPRALGEPITLPPIPSIAESSQGSWDLIEEHRLPNGVRFVTIVRRNAPLTQLVLGFDRGVVDAPPGVADVAAHAIALGDPYGIDGMYAHEHLETFGATLGSAAFSDALVVRLGALPMHLSSAVERMLPLMAAPDFGEGSVKLARLDLAGWRARHGDVRSKAGHRLFQEMFPPPQARGTPPGLFGATEATLRQVEPSLVRAFGEAFVTAEHAFVVLAGDFEPDEVKPIVARALSKLRARSTVTPPPIAPPAKRSSCEHRVVLVPQAGLSQVTLAIGAVVPSPSQDDFAFVEVLSEAAAGGLDARLPRRIRTELGATYHVGTHLFPSRFNGVLTLVTAVDPKRAIDALRSANEELDRLAAEPLDERELAVAKLRALNSEDGSSLESTAVGIARDMGSGLSIEAIAQKKKRIRSTSADDVRAVANRHLRSAQRCIVLFGDVQGLAEPIRELGLGAVEIRSQ